MLRIERVARVVDEVDLAVEAGKDALRLQAALEIESDLGGMRAPDLGQVRDHVIRGVEVRERAAIGLQPGSSVADPRVVGVEDEVRNVVGLHRVGE